MAGVTTIPLKTQTVRYPESDGNPMTETDKHRREMTAIIEALTAFFRDSSEVYVSGNLMLYYEEGNPAASVSPDVFVVKGVSNKERRVYKTWDEGKPPDVAIELTLRSTRLEDLGTKRALYAELGVAEYFLYDPHQEYLKPPLQGLRLENSSYVPIAADPQGRLPSAILDLTLQIVEGDLRLFDARTQKYLLTPREAQTEVERLREELKRLRSVKRE